ncbi:MAG TPA: hypothetical protein VGQ75_10350 [Thermoanaerobaculia bacterium]|jgi:hypothetical protein|nr:hypothetical protein [Thermoanaerobaculia bacterium]HEV8608857.1 hypothetical protein [Thermoanaerobaculia bacterium]
MSARADRVKITAEVPREVWRRVKIQAAKEGRKSWEIVTEALTGYLNGEVGGVTFDTEGNIIRRARKRKGRK